MSSRPFCLAGSLKGEERQEPRKRARRLPTEAEATADDVPLEARASVWLIGALVAPSGGLAVTGAALAWQHSIIVNCTHRKSGQTKDTFPHGDGAQQSLNRSFTGASFA